MALPLAGWNTVGACQDCACQGGLVKTFIIRWCLITDITIDDATRTITGFTTAVPGGQVTEYIHDNDNDTSFFNQTGERVNNRCHQFVQESLGEYYCYNQDANEEANSLSKLDPVVAIHVLENGVKLVQGVDIYEDPANAGTYLFKRSKKPALTIMDVLSGTGAEVALVRIKVNSTANCASAVTDMTEAAILAI